MFKTPDLFSCDLPALPAGSESIRFHYADMANMPMWVNKPTSAWDETSWDNDSSFRGGATMSEAITLARQGWPEGAEQAKALHDGIQASVPVRRRMARYDVAGQVPNMPRALAGNPMFMYRMVRSETAQRPIISLVCDICVDCSCPASGMLAHAAAVASAVDFLEDDGFRCSVLVIMRTRCSKFTAEIAVQLKAPEQPLNLVVMAYGLGHPSFFRRLMFAILQATKACKPLGSGLGTVRQVPAAPELGTFTIGAADSAGRHAEAPDRFRYILRDLARQDCPGIPEDMQDAA